MGGQHDGVTASIHISAAARLTRLLHIVAPRFSRLFHIATANGGSSYPRIRALNSGAAKLTRLSIEVDPAAISWIVPTGTDQIRRPAIINDLGAVVDLCRRRVDVDHRVVVQDAWLRRPCRQRRRTTRDADERRHTQGAGSNPLENWSGRKHLSSLSARHARQTPVAHAAIAKIDH